MYKCRICGKIYDKIEDVIACEQKCLLQTSNKKKEKEEPLNNTTHKQATIISTVAELKRQLNNEQEKLVYGGCFDSRVNNSNGADQLPVDGYQQELPREGRTALSRTHAAREGGPAWQQRQRTHQARRTGNPPVVSVLERGTPRSGTVGSGN